MALYATLIPQLLLHGDGAGGSAVFTDETGKTVTTSGNTRISTAQSKFGGSSMYFDGYNSYLSIPGTDFLFETNSFTIEMWVYVVAFGASWTALVSKYADGNKTGYRVIVATGVWQFSYVDTAGVVLSVNGSQLPLDTWTHLAVSYDGATIRLFKNGVSDGSAISLPPKYLGSTMPLLVGTTDGGLWFFKGFIDDLRIVKGLAIYTSDFTPSTVQLGLVGLTQLALQPLAPYGPPLAKYNPVIGKPVVQGITPDLIDRLPYGVPYGSYMSGNTLVAPFEFKGRGRITGTVKNTPNQPVWRLLRLYREPGGLLVKSLWSDPVTGAYSFDGIPMGYRYTVVSYDHTGQYRAVIADNQAPELIP